MSASALVLIVWLVDKGIGHINEVTLYQAQLVMRWVTIRRYTVLVCNQPLSPTQLSALIETGYEYRPIRGGSAVHLGR